MSKQFEVLKQDGRAYAAVTNVGVRPTVDDGRGVTVNDPVEVFQSFAKTLHREFDPRILFLILVIVLFLLDIAVRKFKFKWPHELIREHKQKKADKVSKAD